MCDENTIDRWGDYTSLFKLKRWSYELDKVRQSYSEKWISLPILRNYRRFLFLKLNNLILISMYIVKTNFLYYSCWLYTFQESPVAVIFGFSFLVFIFRETLLSIAKRNKLYSFSGESVFITYKPVFSFSWRACLFRPGIVTGSFFVFLIWRPGCFQLHEVWSLSDSDSDFASDSESVLAAWST